MQLESPRLLQDMLDAADAILRYVTGVTREAFLSDPRLKDAVNWNFAVVGEALSQLQKVDPATADQISESRRIIAFRNQLIHGYRVVQSEITGDIIEQKLPVLRSELAALLK